LCGTASAEEPAARLAGAVLLSGRPKDIAASLVDEVGPRFAGSDGAARAVVWATAAMKAAGLKNVHTEPVTVPRWVRGAERAAIEAPIKQPLVVAALGGSESTPPGGISAEVVEVASLDALKALSDEAVRGKIVFYDVHMERTQSFDGYGAAVPVRGAGAIEAAKKGAVAALVRSIGTGWHRLPHTGGTRYADGVPKIPYAALAAEDAEMLHRHPGARVHLELESRREKPVASANVVGEIAGATAEIVLIGAHLDSWDIAPGALDDAAGCAMVLATAKTMTVLGMKPRRTVRAVLFMNEEGGLSGALAYAEAHAGELSKHAAALEADAGAGAPLAFVAASGVDVLTGALSSLSSLVAHPPRVVPEAGADLLPLQAAGVPVAAVEQDVSQYFDWHHTAGDTVDKIDANDHTRAAAAFAGLTWTLADMPGRLPKPPVPKHLPPPKK
jgi:Iap family predicted aminopeptidase